MKRLFAAFALVTMLGHPAYAYLHLGTTVSGRETSIRWQRSPVRWSVTDRGVPGITSQALQGAVARAFAAWEGVPTATVAFQFVGFTGAEPSADDTLSVIGFEHRPELDRVLGATSILLDVVTGEIVESDIFFNSTFDWSTLAQGDPLRFDLESVAVHEVGHLLGLGHSAIGETEMRPGGARAVLGSGAVMFPVSLGRGVVGDRTLQPDDVAAISDLYPEPTFRSRTGIVRGRVVKGGGGVFGAHVTAFNPRDGTLVAGFTLNTNGDFTIAGLTAGPQVIRVEPLDDADLESFFNRRAPVDVEFLVTYAERVAVAPEGGAGPPLDIVVRPK
jgi:hypothetical protein